MAVRRLTEPSTHEGKRPLNAGLVAAFASPRCTARSTRTGKPCQKAALKGMTVCYTHGGAAPQVQAAAALRLALASDAFVKGLVEMATDRKNPAQRITAIKEGLERNQLYAFGVTPPAQAKQGNLTVNTQINTKVGGMSDAELADYKQLLTELKGILPADPPKAIEGETA